MANFFNIPDISPFRFVPDVATPGVHFGDDWACKQIRDFERKVYYRQKWVQANTTKLQIESTIPPQTLKIIDTSKVIAKEITWAVVFDATTYKIYECTVDFTAIPQGVYALYQKVELFAISWAVISELIDVRTAWPNTMLIKYKHYFNDYGVAFSTGIEYAFRVESGLVDYSPERERTAYVNQVASISTLKGQALRTFKYAVGLAPGVAPYIIDILNHIFICDYINIEGKLYESIVGSKWEVQRQKGYPLVWASIEVSPKYTNGSLQFNSVVPLFGGIVTAYNIDASFYGPAPTVPILDIEVQT